MGLEVVLYKPGTRYVNANGKSHMGAFVVRVSGIIDSEDEPVLVHNEWIAADDVQMINKKEWVREKMQKAFHAIATSLVPDDVAVVQPCREDEV